MKKLRVGFLVDDLNVSYYTNQLVDFVKTEAEFDDPVLITGYKKTSGRMSLSGIINEFKRNPYKLFDKILQRLLTKIIRKVELRKNRGGPGAIHPERVRLSQTNKHSLILVQGKWSQSKLFLEFTKDDISTISKANLDCIIRCGTGILRGEILEATTFGVISFHHGDNRVNRGGPPGFWEVLNDEPSSGFIIQRLNTELDGGEVLYRGNLMTAGNWSLNYALLLRKSNFFLMRLLKDLAINRRLEDPESVTLHGKQLLRIQTSKVLVKYFIKILIPLIFNQIYSKILSRKSARWSIAFAEHHNFSKSLWRYKEIKNPKGRFLADPFVISKGETDYVFVEDYFYSDKKGRISVLKINGSNYEFMGVVLEEDFHLSFPFVFAHEGDIFMVPETSEAEDIRLYKSTNFPMEWTLDTILRSNVSAADTMIIRKHEKWFMLTNICSPGHGDHQSELHVFFSDKLQSDNWEMIKSGNPVIFDSRQARNGGMFYHDNILYRVNQIPGKNHYGKSFGLNKVCCLTEKYFSEVRVSEVKAEFKEKITSTHHFSANERIAAVDFARPQRLRKSVKR